MVAGRHVAVVAAESSHLNPQIGSRDGILGMVLVFGNLNSNDTPPPRPYLLILPK